MIRIQKIAENNYLATLNNSVEILTKDNCAFIIKEIEGYLNSQNGVLLDLKNVHNIENSGIEVLLAYKNHVDQKQSSLKFINGNLLLSKKISILRMKLKNRMTEQSFI